VELPTKFFELLNVSRETETPILAKSYKQRCSILDNCVDNLYESYQESEKFYQQ